MLISRALTPSAVSFSYASMLIGSDDPEAMISTSGLPSAASARMYAPLAVSDPGAYFLRSTVARAVERQQRLGRLRQVGRAAHQPGNVLGKLVEDDARHVAAGGRGDRRLLGLLVLDRTRGIHRQVLVPAVGQLALLHLLEFLG